MSVIVVIVVAVAHQFLYGLAERLVVYEWFCGILSAPNFYGVSHADEDNVLFYLCHAEVSLWYEKPAVAVEFHFYCFPDELAEDVLLLLVPSAQTLAQGVLMLVPNALRLEHEAVLENVFAKHQTFLACCLQYATEGGGEKGSAFGVGFGFYVSEKSHYFQFWVIRLQNYKLFSTFPHFSPLYF